MSARNGERRSQATLTPVVLALLWILACGQGPSPVEVSSSDQPTTVDLRALEALGYAGYDREPEGAPPPLAKASKVPPDSGLLLFTNEQDSVVLLDRKGQVAWSMQIPGRNAVELAEALPGGQLATLSVDEGVDVFDAFGNSLGTWDLACHHDLANAGPDRLLVLEHTERNYHGRRVRFDSIVELDLGNPQRAPQTLWDSYEALDALVGLSGSSVLDTPPSPTGGEPETKIYDRFHLNSIMVFPASALGASDPRFAAGNLLLCLRNADLLLVLEPHTGNLVWSFGPGELDFPHHPSLLQDGRILAFDNGWHRSWSRLVEIEPGTPKGAAAHIAWSWQTDPPQSMFSKTRGAVERLANGHSLVTDSESGRLFELDQEGDLTWQWSRPLEPDGSRRRIYRATRVPEVWATKVLGARAKSK